MLVSKLQIILCTSVGMIHGIEIVRQTHVINY